MCCFITPQIKFGDPASAVMYYKAQMGGRERERGRGVGGEEKRGDREREGRAAWQADPLIQLAESVPVFASMRYNRAASWKRCVSATDRRVVAFVCFDHLWGQKVQEKKRWLWFQFDTLFWLLLICFFCLPLILRVLFSYFVIFKSNISLFLLSCASVLLLRSTHSDHSSEGAMISQRVKLLLKINVTCCIWVMIRRTFWEHTCL